MNNKPTKTPNDGPSGDPGSLDWLAFRYVADELPDEQRIAFEARMADDQSAREAVEQAVAVGQAAWQAFAILEGDEVQKVLPVRSGGVGVRRNRKPYWILASAVALLIAAGWITSQLPDDGLGNGVESDLVAVAWAEVVSGGSELEGPEFVDADWETELPGAPDTDWMLVALTEMSGPLDGDGRDVGGEFHFEEGDHE